MTQNTYNWLLKKIQEWVLETGYDINTESKISAAEKHGTYTNSLSYLVSASMFHTDTAIEEFVSIVLNSIPISSNVIDVGCSSGITGLYFLEECHRVIFHDYDGIGLSFLDWLIKKENYTATTVFYDNDVLLPKCDLAIGLDVMEHTGNHLSFLKWISGLGKKVAISFPCNIGHYAPYCTDVIDEWVDKEAIDWLIRRRYFNVVSYEKHDRYFAMFDTVKD